MTQRPRRIVACTPNTRASEERLSFILRSPEVIERSVRSALQVALAVRHPGANAPDAHVFGNLALEALDGVLASMRSSLDPIERHELQASTLGAAAAFARSKLARRLFELPRANFTAAPQQADIAVRDARDRLHVVRLEACASLARRAQTVREIAGGLRANSSQLEPPAIHLFSLRDARLRSFGSSASASAPRRQPLVSGLTARRAS